MNQLPRLILVLLLTLSTAHSSHASELNTPDPRTGKKVASAQEVIRLFPDFSLQGVLGEKESVWPATIHSVQESKDSAVFDIKGHGRHEYPSKDYAGKTFQVILLDTPNGKQTAIILVR